MGIEDRPTGSAIADLPLELLTAVFEAARLDALKHDGFDACALGFSIGCVSRRFRWTVREMPAFWCMIAVRSATDREFRRLLACLAVFPDRAITVDYAASRFVLDRETSYDPLDDGSRFFGVLAAEAKRLRRLHFTFAEEGEIHTMAAAFGPLALPVLEYFAIHAWYHIDLEDEDGNDTETPTVALFDGGAPLLREVHYQGVGFTWASTPTASLRSVILDDPNFSTVDTIGDLEELLMAAPNLKTLHIHGERWMETFTWRWSPGAPTWGTIVCPSLTELKICLYTESLLDILKADMLTTLILDGVTASKLVTFLSQSLLHGGSPFTHVTTLELRYFGYPKVDDCHILMNGVPGVTKLSLLDQVSKNNGPLVEAMTAYCSGWPALHTLDTHGFNKDLVIALLQARQVTHPIRTLLVPDDFLALITNASPLAVDAIRTMDVNFIARPEPSPMYDKYGVQYYSSWSVPIPPFILVRTP